MPSTYTRACFFHGEGKRDRKTVLDSETDAKSTTFFCQVYTEKQDLHSKTILKVIRLHVSITVSFHAKV